MDINGDEEEWALREHIRNILYEYAVTHLTIDYVQFTEDAVSELLSQALVEVPLHDRHSIRLPTDPFLSLTQRYRFDHLEPYQERFQVLPEVLQYLKNVMKVKHGPTKSKSISYEFDADGTEDFVVHEPLSPKLNRRSRRATPHPGSNGSSTLMPQSRAALLTSQYCIKPVSLDDFNDPEVSPAVVLDLNCRLQTEEHQAVSAFLKSAAALSRPGPAYKNKYLDPSTREDSPPLSFREEDSVPMFPRSARLGAGYPTNDSFFPSDFQKMRDLPSKLPPIAKVEDDDMEQFKANMIVVDGWQTYITSSPSPSMPSSSQEDKIDQLFNVSSPDTEISPLKLTRMDVPPIPRNRRIRGSKEQVSPIGKGKSLSSFLLPFITSTPAQKEPKESSSLPEPETSMLGQPPSNMDTVAQSADTLDDEVNRIYESVNTDNPKDVILNETLNEEASLLMKVPDLFPPNEHPPGALFLPTKLLEYVCPPKMAKAHSDQVIPTHKFLKKAKGLQSLSLALPWTPFMIKGSLPTHMDVTGSSTLIDGDDLRNGLPEDHIKTRVQSLLESITELDSSTMVSDTKYFLLDEDHGPLSEDDLYSSEIMLSRVERSRLSGLKHVEDNEEDDSSSDKENQPLSPRPTKRARIDINRHDIDDDSGIAFSPLKQLSIENPSPATYSPSVTFNEDISNPFRFSHPDDVAMVGASSYQHEQGDQQQLFDDDVYPMSQFSTGIREDSQSQQGPFQPLSFESNEALSQHITRRETSMEPHSAPPQMIFDYGHGILDAEANEYAVTDSLVPALPTQPASNLQSHSPANPIPVTNDSMLIPNIATHPLGITDFLKLRAKHINSTDAPSVITHPCAPDAQIESTPDIPEAPRTAPPEIFDKNTMCLPTRGDPSTAHFYMASMETLQKQVLIRTLRSNLCAVGLVERDHLSGVDLILDPNTAIIFASLISLASQREALLSTVSEQSWRYTNLLVIFEAYPISASYKGSASVTLLNAYTPPNLKAIGRFRRDVDLAEACDKKSLACRVRMAFADTVEDAAMLARYLGDVAEAEDVSQGTVWGDRSWLDGDVPEEEESLAAVSGMNRFAAYVILCQITVEEFLDLSPQERIDRFGIYVGHERMVSVNAFVEARSRAIESSDLDDTNSADGGYMDHS
ncbi:uncharacterized protein EV420DRAFT_1640112 [Desarmillaria tabescens]|uniref:Uncharacterized protein n=1 Tax=Armillaria tabescens TaxID=1929756 RepID=A0AA39NA23_ARMTA|nr:uncharacterized protein EV420DRAFT_1640112 [Desarmillaria tabescens]KAK0461811.1 hypothetical protein EV420DRAFT_1640112 [Desarmillaria tabescens]